jgi:hypothetical protein
MYVHDVRGAGMPVNLIAWQYIIPLASIFGLAIMIRSDKGLERTIHLALIVVIGVAWLTFAWLHISDRLVFK